MKRIKYFIFVLVASIVGLVTVDAASISVKANSTSPTVGSSVKVTVSVNGTGTAAGKAGAWEYCVSYDSSKLTLTSPSSPCVPDGVAGFSSTSKTFTFKVKASGSSKVTVKSAVLYDYASEAKMNASIGAVTITGKTQSDISVNPKTDTPQSDNSYLRTLKVYKDERVYELSPAFKKDTVSYTVEVPNDVEEVNIDAFVEDTGKARVAATPSLDKKVKLSEGANKVEIKVIAEKGNTRTYTVNIKRAETAPIVVKVDGKDYTVLRSLEGIDKPKYFVDGKQEIEGEEVPALVNETIGYSLVALKDIDGNVGLYSYNGKEYVRYFEIVDEVLTLVPKDVVNLVKGYEQRKDIDINGNKVRVYYKDADSDFVLLYAMNVSNGETLWYSYDIKEGTLQRYNEVKVEENSGKNIYFYLVIGFALLAGIALLIVFLMMGLNGRLRQKNEKLVKKLKEQKVKVIEHPVFDTEMKVESWKHMKEDDDSMYDDEAFFAREEVPENDINSTVEIKSDSFADEPPKKRKSSRKEAKAKKEAEEAELKAMRDDFLKTRELEITKELQSVEEPKKVKKRGLKKKKK